MNGKFVTNISFATVRLRGYHTLQGDNSLKSVERFDHMMHHAATNFYSTARTLP
jgi:hypothetical protein